MNYVTADIWALWKQDPESFIVVPTNPCVNSKGMAVMGRGIAYDAAKRFRNLRSEFGSILADPTCITPNRVMIWQEYRIITFMVKNHWNEKASPHLIDLSAKDLDRELRHSRRSILCPRVGCGNGGLKWKDVQPILERHLSEMDNLTIVSYPKAK
jgi:hypothetical protein